MNYLQRLRLNLRKVMYCLFAWVGYGFVQVAALISPSADTERYWKMQPLITLLFAISVYGIVAVLSVWFPKQDSSNERTKV